MFKTLASFEIYWPKEACEHLLALTLMAQRERSIPSWGALRQDYDSLMAGYAGVYPEYHAVICTEEMGQLWIYGTKCFDAGFVAHLIQLVMRRFDLDTPIHFEWANIHDNPYPNSFGGGAFVVTKDGTALITTRSWAVDKAIEMRGR